jgi:hypothetical protein
MALIRTAGGTGIMSRVPDIVYRDLKEESNVFVCWTSQPKSGLPEGYYQHFVKEGKRAPFQILQAFEKEITPKQKWADVLWNFRRRRGAVSPDTVRRRRLRFRKKICEELQLRFSLALFQNPGCGSNHYLRDHGPRHLRHYPRRL